jgi:hypothetical protein
VHHLVITGPSPNFGLARHAMPSRLLVVLENGFVNLVAVVGFLILAISIIPAVLYLGTPKSGTGTDRK